MTKALLPLKQAQEFLRKESTLPVFAPALMQDIRSRFSHVGACPFQGPRGFVENAGGALTLNSAVETSAKFAAIPDNQGRDTPTAKTSAHIIERANLPSLAELPGVTILGGADTPKRVGHPHAYPKSGSLFWKYTLSATANICGACVFAPL